MKDIYANKQQWLERLMASEHTPAEKVFAFSIYKRAYGDKLTSYPATEHIQEDTDLARSKYSNYRKALFTSGALTGVKDRKARGRQENYTYTLNLQWDGQVPSGNVKSPVGTTQVPCGDTQVPSGGTNTTSNTTSKTSKKNTKACADAQAGKDSDSPRELPKTSPPSHGDKTSTSLHGEKVQAVPYGIESTNTQVPSGDLKPVGIDPDRAARARAYMREHDKPKVKKIDEPW